jgi:hypothetical protein
MTSFLDMFTTTDEANIRSIFSSITAIKWNGHLKFGYDAELRSIANLVGILFVDLVQNDSNLQEMKDNSSYNRHMEGRYRKLVYKLLDDLGKTVFIQ